MTTTTSEDVLLQMGGVRIKNGDGTLHVMNPNLLKLYKELVTTQVLTSDFRATHVTEHVMKRVNKKQEIGVSGAFLADIKPQADSCNGIFRTYLAVKRKHTENVSAKMTTSEFWTKFCQSQYFHREKIQVFS